MWTPHKADGRHGGNQTRDAATYLCIGVSGAEYETSYETGALSPAFGPVAATR